ncbi:hypothetical protein CSOJ01_03750 [Colletotrichum sojae]|uniref:Uncharacterized protein n=1 Tax=Colletotrichum sojae TaxID=2175907 RepID=A0A8H6JLQ8_9PEZI|nr:hypothetical protein CSOJ01_03750 [Colletotrichum sojae]
MRISITISLAALAVTISALPVAVPPGFFHPPVQAFRDDINFDFLDMEPNVEARSEPAMDSVDVEPHIEARGEIAIDIVDPEPNIKARSEEAVDVVDLEPEIQVRSEDVVDVWDLEPEVHARGEPPVDKADAEPNIKARSIDLADSVDLEPEIPAKEEPHIQAEEEPRIQARGEASEAWVDPGANADDWKYRDNLAKLKVGNCGVDCHRSINSYQSRVSRASRENKGYYDHGYYDNHNNDHHNNKYDYSTVSRSTRSSRGEHNTAADDWKYRDNLVKLDNHNCGVNCHKSLDSYRSVASKDSKLSRERDYYNNYNHHTNTYDRHAQPTYDHHNDYNYNHRVNTYDHHAQPTYNRHNDYDYRPVSRSSRASRGERNTKQDNINFRLNKEKLAKHNCGQGCIDSINSWKSVDSAEAKRRRQAERSRQSRYKNPH